jgi:hypothetical protein
MDEVEVVGRAVLAEYIAIGETTTRLGGSSAQPKGANIGGDGRRCAAAGDWAEPALDASSQSRSRRRRFSWLTRCERVSSE